MTETDAETERPLRWIETPLGRGLVNGVALVVLLSLTQHFGWTDPGPPVRLENISLYAVYGVAVGAIMYVWTSIRLKREHRRREDARLLRSRRAAYDAEDDGPGTSASGQ